MSEVLHCSIEGHVAVVTIDRPPVNALSSELIAQLRPMFEGLNADRRVRAVVVTGGRSKFSAGFDIRELLAAPPEDAVPRNARFMEIFDRVESARPPVIAAINGYALGGGLELAMACDVRIVSAGAVLALPEINLGGLPGIGGMQRLQRLVGPSLAKRMVLTGARVTAEEAYRIGLVDEIADGDAGGAAMRLAAELASKAPLSVSAGKRALNAGRDLSLADAQQSDLQYIDEVARTDDRIESLRAFLEKRPAVITGR